MRIFPVLALASALTFAGAASAQRHDQAIRITNGPNVEGVGDSWAVIAWSTNEGGSSVVRYGTDPNRLDRSAEAPYERSGSGAPHRVRIQGLQPGTRYFFRVESGQGQGTGSGTEARGEFTTKGNGAGYNNEGRYDEHHGPGGPNDYGRVRIVNGPNVEGVGRDFAVIAWSTNTGASSIVRYGTSPNNLDQTAEGPYADQVGSHNNPHRVRLQGLRPGTHYFFRVESGQGQRTGSEAEGRTGEFTTRR